MRDDEGRAPLQKLVQRLLNQNLGVRVDRGGRLVENQNLRVVQQRAREGNQLLLPDGQAAAAFVDLGQVALFHLHDEVVRVHGLGRLNDLLVGRAQLAVADVVHDGAGEDEAVLHHDAHLLAQRAQLHVAHVVAVQQHRAAGHVVEPADQVDHGALARAGGADERNRLPGLHGKGYVLQNGLFAVIGEGYVVEIHTAGNRRQVDGVGLILNVGRRVHDFENALHGRHGGQNAVVEVRQGIQRLPEAPKIPSDQQEV